MWVDEGEGTVSLRTLEVGCEIDIEILRCVRECFCGI